MLDRGGVTADNPPLTLMLSCKAGPASLHYKNGCFTTNRGVNYAVIYLNYATIQRSHNFWIVKMNISTVLSDHICFTRWATLSTTRHPFSVALSKKLKSSVSKPGI
jgi:hypothetical protein